MSPEVIRGTGATPFSDVYSFGVVRTNKNVEIILLFKFSFGICC
jgi:hypothetical protein